MTEFFMMNGYGGFVWSAIAFSLLALLAQGLIFYYRHQNLLAKLLQIQAEEQLVARFEQEKQGIEK